ncbi:HPP family protein [Acidisphaera rubrifaciens]|uniref:HPP family protein n=1 Tax=Acidisphaera rubrifaciens TaxID=50715 RepID=UPI00130D99AF|nr:HPP family protein [Acidisphaera rubrifaciens]
MLLTAAILGVVAAIAVWWQEPFLAPSLGSAVFTQLLHPEEASARPYAILMGQVLGAASGFAGVFLTGANMQPPFMGAHPLVWTRVAAIVVTAVLAASLQLVSGALTPAGGATALIVAIGAEADDPAGAAHLAVGLLLVTSLGEAARRLVLRMKGADRPT